MGTSHLAGWALLLLICWLQTAGGQPQVNSAASAAAPSALWTFDACQGQKSADSVKGVMGALGAQVSYEACSGSATSCTLSMSADLCNHDVTPGMPCDDELNGGVMSVKVPTAIKFDNKREFSVSAWVYPTKYADGAPSVIVTRQYDAISGDQFGLTIGAAGTFDVSSAVFYVAFKCKATPGKSCTTLPYGVPFQATGTKVPLNQWTHVAGVFKSGKLYVYVNGKRAGKKSIPSPYTTAGAKPLMASQKLYVGGRPAWDQFTGRIDCVALYTTGLSDADVKSQIQQQKGAQCGCSMVAPDCAEAPPTLANGTWDCTATTSGGQRQCAGRCEPGFTGSPVATCSTGSWSVSGSCVGAAPFYPPPSVNITGTGTVLTPDVLFMSSDAQLISCTDNSLTIPSMHAEHIQNGSVLLGTLAAFDWANPTTCTWIVRKVVGLSAAGANTVLITEPATLLDIVEEMHFSSTDVLGLLPSTAAAALRPASQTTASSVAPAGTLADWLKIFAWKTSVGIGVTVTPIFDFSPEMPTSVDIVDHTVVRIKLGLKGSLKLGLKFAVKASMSSGLKIDMFDFVPSGIPWPSFPIPCVPGVALPICRVTAKIDSKLALEIAPEAEIGLVAEVSFSASFGVELGYDANTGVFGNTLPLEFKNTSPLPTITAGCNIKLQPAVGFGPKLVLGVGPTWLTSLSDYTDVFSATTEIKLAVPVSFSIKYAMPPGKCDMCNSACPRVNVKIEPSLSMAEKVSTEGALTWAGQKLKMPTEKKLEFKLAMMPLLDECVDLPAVSVLQPVCCLGGVHSDAAQCSSVDGCSLVRAVDDTAECTGCTSLTIEPLANDQNIPADVVTLLSVPATTELGGSLTISGTHTVLYTPPASASTSCNMDRFTYTLTCNANTTSATVSIALHPTGVTLGKTYSIVAPKAGQTCSTACSDASAPSDSACKMRAMNAGRSGFDMCLVLGTANGAASWIAGMTNSANYVSCSVGTSSAVPAQPPAGSPQRCLCTPCVGVDCGKYFWKAPNASVGCPPPPTAVPVSSASVFWGTWCSSQTNTEPASVPVGSPGYVSSGKCVTPAGVSDVFNQWCPKDTVSPPGQACDAFVPSLFPSLAGKCSEFMCSLIEIMTGPGTSAVWSGGSQTVTPGACCQYCMDRTDFRCVAWAWQPDPQVAGGSQCLYMDQEAYDGASKVPSTAITGNYVSGVRRS